MADLNEVWKGQLCHKNKTIAEVLAFTGILECPIDMPKQLDVHQKVKYEEFTEKVVKKSTDKLTFNKYLNQEEHCLMVVVFSPTNEKSILPSFMTFLTKTQSVGVSVLGENESVIFLVPSGLASDGMFPVPPKSLHKNAGNLLFGILKISKSILQSLEKGRKILKELAPLDVKPNVALIGNIGVKTPKIVGKNIDIKKEKSDKSIFQSPEKLGTKSNEVPDSLPEKATFTGKNLTRLSVYMSNLPLLSNRNDAPKKDPFISTLKAPRKKLSLKDYKRRIENKESHSPDLPDLTIDGENLNKTDSVGAYNLNESIDESDISANDSIQNEKLVDNSESNDEDHTRDSIDESTNDDLNSVTCRTPDTTKPEESNVLSPQETSVSCISESNMEETKKAKKEVSIVPVAKINNVITTAKIKVEKIEADYEMSDETVSQSSQNYPVNNITLVTNIKEELEVNNNVSSDDSEGEMEEDLPDLGADSDSEMETDRGNDEAEPHNNPGESISFKSSEIVIFKPKVYARVLEDLDRLKLYLGDTAKSKSTAHREKCMQLVDVIGDKLIGTRIRKKTTVRSIGNETNVQESKPKIFVTTEVQTDEAITTENVCGEEFSGTESQITEEKVTTKSQEKDPQEDSPPKPKKGKQKRTSLDSGLGEKTLSPVLVPSETEISGDEIGTDNDTEGYFTMLLKLNGALDDRPKKRSQSKTIKRTVTTSSYRVATKTSYNPPTVIEPILPDATAAAKDFEPNGRCTPEMGAQPCDGTNVLQYVDGRLRFQGNNSVQGPFSSSIRNEKDHGIDHTSYPYHEKDRQVLEADKHQLLNYDDRSWNRDDYQNNFAQDRQQSEMGYDPYIEKATVDNRREIDDTNAFSPNIINVKGDRANNDENSHLLQSFAQAPSYNAEHYAPGIDGVQPNYQDIDLRKDAPFRTPDPPFPNPVFQMPNEGYHAVPPLLSSIPLPPIPPSDRFVADSTSSLNPESVFCPAVTSTVDTTYYTANRSVTEVIHDVDVIDKEMESEMVDILEILHEGTAAEQANLKKPKGRSKRARKKRRAIAEAEKLFSLVMLAEKIESQHKLSVLSEKQKKREFYKKIIQTYAAKGPDNRAPKDEQTMIMECVQQLMGDADGDVNDEQSSVKDGSEKRKSIEDIDFSFDNYEGLSEKKKKKYDDDDCKIVDTLRHERMKSERKIDRRHWGRGRVSPQQAFGKNRGRIYNGRRSCSSERSSWSRSSPEKQRRKELPRKKHVSGLFYSKRKDIEMSPQKKHQMFEMWPDRRYIDHLFITANKITYGAENGRSWLLKVKSCIASITDRRSTIRKRIEGIRKELSGKDTSFSQREKHTEAKTDHLKNLKNLDILAGLYNFYQCKCIILDTLQQTSEEKQSNPDNYKDILTGLCDKLDFELENLRLSRKELDIHKKLAQSESDKRLVKKALDECIDMIDNIRSETRKYREQIKK